MTIRAKGDTSANAILARDYPVIEENNDSFPDGDYVIETEYASSDTSRFKLRHRVERARLVESLISEKKAVYACALAAPRSAYREILHSDDAMQDIVWDRANFGEPPYFTPMIVCTEECSRVLKPDADDVHSDWDGIKVTFPKGAWLALGPVLQLKASGIQSLISIRSDDTLAAGQFRTEAVDGDMFRFDVRCHPDLHNLLQRQSEHYTQRADIMIHIVTSCFAALQRKYPVDDEDEGWRAYKSLEVLSIILAAKNYCDWSDPEFQPEAAATLLYPHDPASMVMAPDD